MKLNIAFILLLALGLGLSTTHGIASNNNKEKKMEVATFGGGCFWCTEAFFEQIDGVKSVISGYSGGEIKNPTYKAVCAGITGHAEVIQVKYDSQKVSFIELMEVFFKTHDPTTLDQQGADSGSQYRSIVLYHNEEQKLEVEKLIELLNEEQIWKDTIVTEVKVFEKFYNAEAYHQGYYDNNKNQPYCKIVITPKLEKFEKTFSNLMKTK